MRFRAAQCEPISGSAEQGNFYRNWRPTRLGRILNKGWTWAAGLGLLPEILVALRVRSSASHRFYSVVLVAAKYRGHRYLVLMLGNGSNWVQDVRAAQGQAFIKRGRSCPVILAEIPPEKRAPILKAWCQIATSGRQHLPVPHDAPASEFEAIAADYPVFRVDTVTYYPGK